MIRAAIAVGLAAAALAGCSRDPEPSLPGACRSGIEDFRAALRAAPAEVRVAGTPLSECLSKASKPGDVESVGGVYVNLAAGLAVRAKRDPESREAAQLGYLVGAVRRGAGETQGLHYEMARRIEQEAAPVAHRSAAFAEGERAGRDSG